MKEYNILKDVTIEEVPYAAGQVQAFADDVAAPFVESGDISAVSPE